MELVVTLSDELAERAEAAGLLTQRSISSLLETELKRRQSGAQFRDMVRAIRAVEPPITTDEIEAELNARKAERLATAKQSEK